MSLPALQRIEVPATASADRVYLPCQGCIHRPSEHLLLLGPARMCLEPGCACGRRALMAAARALLPFLPVIAAFGYLAYHLAVWAALRFRVVG